MKKRLISKLLLIVMLGITPLYTVAGEPIRISVLYFTNTSGSGELAWLEKGLADMLLTDLSLSEDIKGIEREQLEKIINEQSFSLSGMTDDRQSLEIGKLLSAQMLLTGSFIESGGRLRIDGKLLDTETGELRAAVKSEGSMQNIFEMESEIARGVLKNLGIKIPEGMENSKSASLRATEAYYTGLQLFDNGEYDKAVEYYRQAAVEDPEYDKPRAGLEESYRFLRDFRRMRYQREINTLLGKADILRNRLNREPWITYSDFIMQAYMRGETDNEKLTGQAEELGLLSGESPAICAWNLQTTLYEIADLAIEYFEDEQLRDYSYAEIIDIARQARINWAEDAFLPELIYQELLVTHYQGKWQESLTLCEELMLEYPDYRMMWAVEDFYEDALQSYENEAKS